MRIIPSVLVSRYPRGAVFAAAQSSVVLISHRSLTTDDAPVDLAFSYTTVNQGAGAVAGVLRCRRPLPATARAELLMLADPAQQRKSATPMWRHTLDAVVDLPTGYYVAKFRGHQDWVVFEFSQQLSETLVRHGVVHVVLTDVPCKTPSVCDTVVVPT